jgi:hypothetical protein
MPAEPDDSRIERIRMEDHDSDDVDEDDNDPS